jgi:hypothetical protein
LKQLHSDNLWLCQCSMERGQELNHHLFSPRKKWNSKKPVNCAFKCYIPDLTLLPYGMINDQVLVLWKRHWTHCAPVYTHSAASGWLVWRQFISPDLIGGNCTAGAIAARSTATRSRQAQSSLFIDATKRKEEERRPHRVHVHAVSDGS